MEQVEHLDEVLGEIERVLKPGGCVLSLFPDRSVWREGHCGVPFLHWFPKRSRLRVYYAALFRMAGFGHHKGEKRILTWSKDFCEWLDARTHYRSYGAIRPSFEKRFAKLQFIEPYWLRQRLEKRFPIFQCIPRFIQTVAVRKLVGLVFVAKRPDPSHEGTAPRPSAPPWQ